MTRVRLVGLAKSFGTVWAVRDVSLEVEEGEFFSLLGPSGCGKTTTMRIVAGLEKPTRGQVWFEDTDITAVPPQHRNVGLVFQSYAVFPTMTVYDNVAYGLRIRRLPGGEVDHRVHSVLDILALGALASRMPAQLSGGELQRVALARALAIQPRVLLLDEPLSNLDAKLRVEVRVEIRKLQRDLGITTIYVTHDQEEALSVSDRVGVMNQGVVEQIGRPEEIYQRPTTRFVASFVGEGTILEGRLVRDADRCRVAIGDRVSLTVEDPGVKPGPVWVCIRPEALRVAREASPSAPAAVGVVEHVEFVGPTIRVVIRVPGLDRPLRLSGSSVELAGAFRLGTSTRVEIDPRGVAIGILDDTAGGSAGNGPDRLPPRSVQ